MISVTGSDAGEFLQGQLTQDIELVGKQGCLPAAWCNPKGRVIIVMRIIRVDGGYGLVMPASLADSACERFKMFRFRADVELEVSGSDWAHLVFKGEMEITDLEPLELRPEQEVNASRKALGLTAINIGIEEACVELFGLEADFKNAGIDTNDHADFQFLSAARIRAGIPEITGNYTEKYTPHMLNLDLIGAISFDKGCYTGQEVVARTQNLGSSKRRLMRYRAASTLTSGDKLSDGERDVGEVLNVVGSDLLAVTPVDIHNRTLVSDGVEVTPANLPYL